MQEHNPGVDLLAVKQAHLNRVLPTYNRECAISLNPKQLYAPRALCLCLPPAPPVSQFSRSAIARSRYERWVDFVSPQLLQDSWSTTELARLDALANGSEANLKKKVCLETFKPPLSQGYRSVSLRVTT